MAIIYFEFLDMIKKFYLGVFEIKCFVYGRFSFVSTIPIKIMVSVFFSIQEIDVFR